ncbi:MAG: RNA polymerase sigma factor [Solirubrobacteraceae bacterium]
MALIEEVIGMGAGDVGELYGALADRLERIVRLDVRASDAVIEDACQVAWVRLLHHRQRVHRETVMAWLARTAVREAVRLLRRDRREASLEGVIEADVELPSMIVLTTPHELFEQRERLQQTGRLPERQQRLVWLHALGLTYVEMAAHEGCSLRTVERQLLRANAALRNEPAPAAHAVDDRD